MRLSLFVILILSSASAGFAQTAPELGPGAEIPSVDDLDTLIPETDEDQPAVVASDEAVEPTKLDALFASLKQAQSDAVAERIARQIQIQWLESGSDTVDLLMSRAGAALKGEDLALALDLLDVVVTLSPGFAEGWNRRATAFYMQQDFARSLVDIERTLALEPRHWGAMSGLGIIQRRLGHDDRALETFKSAVEINPGLSNARESIEALEKAAEGEPA
ncbi:tetratricopeptide repeat protein [Roseibium algae]|uniref:Tetratricopeptide repeat protein n=1 Tax=Roseibium algae TaxID=3123038 RepID=A0ABU8TGN6_9HYPH